MNDKALKFLGLLFIAKKLSIGDDAKRDAKRNKSSLIIIANDISEASEKEVINACLESKTRIIKRFTKEELGNSIGKNLVAIISINDKKASSAFLKKCE